MLAERREAGENEPVKAEFGGWEELGGKGLGGGAHAPMSGALLGSVD